MSDIRPIPTDPAAELVHELIEADQTWLLSDAGAYQAFAAETMNNDGGEYQRAVLLIWPCRINKTQEKAELRLVMSPADARYLADVLVHVTRWLEATEMGE